MTGTFHPDTVSAVLTCDEEEEEGFPKFSAEEDADGGLLDDEDEDELDLEEEYDDDFDEDEDEDEDLDDDDDDL